MLDISGCTVSPFEATIIIYPALVHAKPQSLLSKSNFNKFPVVTLLPSHHKKMLLPRPAARIPRRGPPFRIKPSLHSSIFFPFLLLSPIPSLSSTFTHSAPLLQNVRLQEKHNDVPTFKAYADSVGLDRESTVYRGTLYEYIPPPAPAPLYCLVCS